MKIQRQNQEILLGKQTASELVKEYGSPLYVYDETTLRERCRQLKTFCSLPNFHISYSAKANTSVSLMKIIREEGILVDALSLGEIYLETLAGYQTNEILFLSNNVGEKEFREVIQKGIRVCVDSFSELELYGSMNPGGEVYIRLNPKQGAGHHEKVVTAGQVKFGIEWDQVDQAFQIAQQYSLKITGFIVHIGSLFLAPDIFHRTVEQLLDLAEKYPGIEYIDFGGGIGVPYHREKEKPFPLTEYGKELTATLQSWMNKTGRSPTFGIQPGRFVVAECGVCLATVRSVKKNQGISFIGTDLGFNFLIRPEMYGSYHEILHANKNGEIAEYVTIVGNVCESGDILGKDRPLPHVEVEDILLVRDTGAYGFSMASNYNSMVRPAEVLIDLEGNSHWIRRRESIEDISRNQVF